MTTGLGTFTMEEDVIDIKTIQSEIEDIGFGCEFMNKVSSKPIIAIDNRISSAQSASNFTNLTSEASEVNSTNNKQSSVEPETSQYLVTVTSLSEERNQKHKSLLTIELINRFIEALRQKAGVVDVSFLEKNGSMKLTPLVSAQSHYVRLTCNLAEFGPRDAFRLSKDFGLKLEVGLLGGFSMASRLAQQYDDETRGHRNTTIISWLFTIPILTITMVLPMFPWAKEVLNKSIFPGFNINACLLVILSFPVQWIVGMKFHTKALKSIMNKSSSLGMDFLISTGEIYIYPSSSQTLFQFI